MSDARGAGVEGGLTDLELEGVDVLHDDAADCAQLGFLKFIQARFAALGARLHCQRNAGGGDVFKLGNSLVSGDGRSAGGEGGIDILLIERGGLQAESAVVGGTGQMLALKIAEGAAIVFNHGIEAFPIIGAGAAGIQALGSETVRLSGVEALKLAHRGVLVAGIEETPRIQVGLVAAERTVAVGLVEKRHTSSVLACLISRDGAKRHQVTQDIPHIGVFTEAPAGELFGLFVFLGAEVSQGEAVGRLVVGLFPLQGATEPFFGSVILIIVIVAPRDGSGQFRVALAHSEHLQLRIALCAEEHESIRLGIRLGTNDQGRRRSRDGIESGLVIFKYNLPRTGRLHLGAFAADLGGCRTLIGGYGGGSCGCDGLSGGLSGKA